MNQTAIAVSGDTVYNKPSAIVGRVPSHGGSWSLCEPLELFMNHAVAARAFDVRRSLFDVRCSMFGRRNPPDTSPL
jgi:hypothetical protein